MVSPALNVRSTSKRYVPHDRRCEKYLCTSTPNFLPSLSKDLVNLDFSLRRLLAAGLSVSVEGQDEAGDPSDWNSMASLKMSRSVSRFQPRGRSVCADILALSRATSMFVKARRGSGDGSTVRSCSLAVLPETLFALVSTLWRV